jgi:hypothetical protein
MALGALVVVVAAIVLAALDAGAVELGTVARYAPGSVVYRSTDGLFVVRSREGALLALSDVDPHNPPGTRSCLVTFRPDLGPPGEGLAGERGRFFDICTGSMYDLSGQALGGDGLNLRGVRIEELEEGRLRAFPRERQ